MGSGPFLVFILLSLVLSCSWAEIPGCLGIPICGGLKRGLCFAANASASASCVCSDGWTGAGCTTAYCPGVNGTGCSANEYCEELLDPPSCLCNISLGFAGPDCVLVDTGCPGDPDCTDNVTNGVCNMTTNECKCLKGWTGLACNVPNFCPLGPNNFTCSGNGECVPNEVDYLFCRCYIGWLGTDCWQSVCDVNCSHKGVCISEYPPRCDCHGDRVGGQACNKIDQNDNFNLAPITKAAAFGIAVGLTALAFLIVGLVVYMERTYWQCLTKQEREDDDAYAKLEAARRLANEPRASKSSSDLGGKKGGSRVSTSSKEKGRVPNGKPPPAKGTQLKIEDDAPL